MWSWRATGSQGGGGEGAVRKQRGAEEAVLRVCVFESACKMSDSKLTSIPTTTNRKIPASSSKPQFFVPVFSFVNQAAESLPEEGYVISQKSSVLRPRETSFIVAEWRMGLGADNGDGKVRAFGS